MTDGLSVRPELTVTAQIRRASSSCCAAPLASGAEPGTFTCRACGQPCDRVMSAPEEVTWHG